MTAGREFRELAESLKSQGALGQRRNSLGTLRLGSDSLRSEQALEREVAPC